MYSARTSFGSVLAANLWLRRVTLRAVLLCCFVVTQAGAADEQRAAVFIDPAWWQLAAGDTFQLKFQRGNGSFAADHQFSNLKRTPLANRSSSIVANWGAEGVMVLTLAERQVHGTLASEEGMFALTGSKGQYGQLTRIDTQLQNPAGRNNDYLVPPDARKQRQLGERSAKLETLANSEAGTSIVDVLVVYSPEFASLSTPPLTRLAQFVSFTNEAFLRSGIQVRLRLVRAQQLNFDNQAGLGDNLEAATQGLGSFAELPALRDEVGADLVVVMHGGTGFSASGIAWVSGELEQFGFSAMRMSEVCCDTVFAHEIGHNFGSGHEHAAVNPSASFPCTEDSFAPYACGHGNAAAGWGTVMSRLDDAAIGFQFSNLDSDCFGQPCGVPEGQLNAADNRKAFNISRFFVQDFRSAAVPETIENPDPTPPPAASRWLPAIFDLLTR